jgi:hypothetical protein
LESLSKRNATAEKTEQGTIKNKPQDAVSAVQANTPSPTAKPVETVRENATNSNGNRGNGTRVNG